MNAFAAGTDAFILKGVESPKDSPSKVAEEILDGVTELEVSDGSGFPDVH